MDMMDINNQIKKSIQIMKSIDEMISDCICEKDLYIKEIQDKISLLSSNDYPQIIFPSSFSESLSKFKEITSYEVLRTRLKTCQRGFADADALRILEKPEIPLKPSLRYIPATYKKGYKRNLLQRFYLIITNGPFLTLLLTIIVYLMLFLLFGSGKIFFIVLLVCIAIILTFIVGNSDFFKDLKDLFCSDIYSDIYYDVPYTEEEYDRLRKEEEDHYNYAMKQYYNEIERYIEKLMAYQNALAEQIECISCGLHRIIPSLFSRSEEFSVVDEGPQRGRSEDKLFASLMRFSSLRGSIHIDTTIAGYYPDLTISTSNNIYIDVEIDEPYEMGTQRGIHYIGCGDEERNKRICNKNWVVLRFSEKQIITDIETCIRIIGILKGFIEGHRLTDIEGLFDVCISIKERCWNREEARFMALNNYRETY